MKLEPIGTLRCLTAATNGNGSLTAIEMALDGRTSDYLASLKEYSHAIITGWLGSQSAGTLATRVVRVAGCDEGRLVIESIDWPEGTAILSLEGYKSADCVFSARSDHDLVYSSSSDDTRLLTGLIGEAAKFHGETCAGVILGAKIMLHIMQTWRIGRKDSGLRLWLGSDGCIGDALMALSGITLGTGRLKVPGGRIYRFVLEDKGLAYYPTEAAFAPAAEVSTKSVEELFAIREESQRSGERKPAHDKRAPKRAKEEEALIQRVRNSLVEDKLPCAIAYKIAEDLNVHIVDVGRAADEARVKISHCQLGCFR